MSLLVGAGLLWCTRVPGPPAARSSNATKTSAESAPEGTHKTPTALASLPPTLSPRQYAEKIHALGRDLSQPEQRRWIAWMRGDKPAHLGIESWHWLVNDVMDKLCHQVVPLSEWSDELIAMSSDRQADPVLRDYAIQHMVDWIQPVQPGEPYEKDRTKRDAMVAAMMRTATETKQSLSGTALNGLHMILLNRERTGFDQKAYPLSLSVGHIRPLAEVLARSAQADPLARITAFQVCAQRRFVKALDSIREVAVTDSLPVSLRLSAIAALGQLGKKPDESIVKSFVDQGNPRLAKAARTALNMLQMRAQQ